MISKLLNFSQMDIGLMALGFDINYYHIIEANNSSIKVVNSYYNLDHMDIMSMLSSSEEDIDIAFFNYFIFISFYSRLSFIQWWKFIIKFIIIINEWL
jgi:hypothetical protein